MSQRYPYFTLLDGSRGSKGIARALEVLNCREIGEFVMVVSPHRQVIVRRVGVDREFVWGTWLGNGLDEL